MPVAAPSPALPLAVNVLHVTYIDATGARDSEECGRLRLGLFELYSRGDWIRTSDLLLPKQARYRATLRPETTTTPPNGMRPERVELPTF